MLRTLTTICGALLILQTTALMTQPAQAHKVKGDVAPVTTSVTTSVTTDEEQIGDKVFQVGRVTINASPSQVQSVLTDYPHTAKIFDNVTKCNIVCDKGNTKLIAFTIKSMGNLWTFDYVLEVKEEPGSIQWHRSSGAFKANDGFWKLEPVNGGAMTQVTYAKYVDGGLLLPKCVVNKQIRDSMPLIMTSLKTTAEQSTVATTRTLPHN